VFHTSRSGRGEAENLHGQISAPALPRVGFSTTADQGLELLFPLVSAKQDFNECTLHHIRHPKTDYPALSVRHLQVPDCFPILPSLQSHDLFDSTRMTIPWASEQRYIAFDFVKIGYSSRPTHPYYVPDQNNFLISPVSGCDVH
jgi:hypothetical protein